MPAWHPGEREGGKGTITGNVATRKAFCLSVSVYKQSAVYSAVCMFLIRQILLQQDKAGELVAVQEGRATTVCEWQRMAQDAAAHCLLPSSRQPATQTK